MKCIKITIIRWKQSIGCTKTESDQLNQNLFTMYPV